jgi:hypothetical protein
MNIFIKSSLFLVIVFSVVLLAGCDRKVDFQVSPAVPAATAKGKVSKDRNDNTVVEFTVRNLASPERLTPSRNYYVVWIQPPGQFPENRGQLIVNNKLSGKKSITTPHREFDVFITAEDTLTGTVPAGEQIMRASPRR